MDGKIIKMQASHINIAAINSHIGESRIMSDGRKAVIIRFKDENDMDVLLDNGHVMENISYKNFLGGKLTSCKIINFSDFVAERNLLEN